MYDTTLAPAFFSTIITSLLYGVMVLQAFFYFQHSANDAMTHKVTISILSILETIRFSFLLHTMYKLFVSNFGSIEFFNYPPWSFVAAIMISNIVELLVRCVYAHRVYVLFGRYRRWWRIALPAIILSISIMAFATGEVYGAKRSQLHMFETKEHNSVSVYLAISFAGAIVADFTSAISLCTVLFHSRTGIQRTDSILRILMAFTINTGLLTSFCTTACFVTYTVWPLTFIYMGLLLPKSQLYVSSYLATLNAREAFRRDQSINSSRTATGVTLTSANAIHTAMTSFGNTTINDKTRTSKGSMTNRESLASSDEHERGSAM